MKTFLTILTFLVRSLSFSQTLISGQVNDEKGEPIPGANVILQNTYDGSSTDAQGTFKFSTTETGKQVLVIRFIGFAEFTREIVLEGKPIVVSAELKETINELEAVIITAGSFAASDENRRTIFKAVDIATTAGATADIAGALNTLPGTQKVGESGRLFVRGGDGSEARTFIDGLVVMDSYSPAAPNTPSRGRFMPFMFKGISFSSGGYSAEYGQALSSALALDSKDESDITRTDISLLSVGADVARTQAWKTGSWAGKIQYTDIRPYFGLVNQYLDWKMPPVSIEGMTAFRQRVGKDGMMKFYGNLSNSKFALYNHDIDDENIKYLYDLNNNYGYLNGSYKQAINEKWILRGGLSYTYTFTDTKVDLVKTNEKDEGIHSKIVFDGSLSEKVNLKAGGEVIRHTHSQQAQPGTDLKFIETISVAFVEADIYTSNKFVTRAGTRAEYNHLLHNLSVDPRLSLAYKTGKKGQVSLAYGKFRQSAKPSYVRINNHLLSEKADHYILNYQIIEDYRTFRVEAYYKKYNDLVKFNAGNPEDLSNRGEGYAKGFELFWRDNRSIPNVDYWISYSFLDTERDYLNTPYSVTPTFASKHNFSAVYKHFITAIKSQLGFTYSYTSSRLYNDPNQEAFNGSKTPAYHDLSANIAYLPRPSLIIYFSCTNVLGRDNIFGYEYSSAPDALGVYKGRAIEQPARRFLFLGIFITLSKNSTVNQLPTL